MAAMKNPAMRIPSGRSMALSIRVYKNTNEISPNITVASFWPLLRADKVTATAAEVISTSTPVAYAPPWASTSALKMIVTTTAMAM